MGIHDPLDGYVSYLELQTLSSRLPELPDGEGLGSELADIASICKGGSWVTGDPLGIGGLLFDASRIGQLMTLGAPDHSGLLRKVLDSALPGMEAFSGSDVLQLPAQYRLAFREFGLSIGLRAVERLNEAKGAGLPTSNTKADLRRPIELLARYVPFAKRIETFWTDASNQDGATWLEHQDINAVMLATSLAPDSFLSV